MNIEITRAKARSPWNISFEAKVDEIEVYGRAFCVTESLVEPNHDYHIRLKFYMPEGITKDRRYKELRAGILEALRTSEKVPVDFKRSVIWRRG